MAQTPERSSGQTPCRALRQGAARPVGRGAPPLGLLGPGHRSALVRGAPLGPDLGAPLRTGRRSRQGHRTDMDTLGRAWAHPDGHGHTRPGTRAPGRARAHPDGRGYTRTGAGTPGRARARRGGHGRDRMGASMPGWARAHPDWHGHTQRGATHGCRSGQGAGQPDSETVAQRRKRKARKHARKRARSAVRRRPKQRSRGGPASQRTRGTLAPRPHTEMIPMRPELHARPTSRNKALARMMVCV